MTSKKTGRLTKAQAAFLQEQDTRRAVQALGDRMDMEAEYNERQLELQCREQEVQRLMLASGFRADPRVLDRLYEKSAFQLQCQ